MAVKSNFVLDDQPEDNFSADKPIEGIKTMPYLVILYLLKSYNIPVDLMFEHFNITDKSYRDFDKRLSRGLYRNNVKLLTKIKLCKNWLSHMQDR